MKKVKKWWMVLLLGALLMATVVGVAGARPMRQTTYKLTIPAAHFNPRQDGYDWINNGYYVAVNSGTAGYFYAALPIALPGRFTVEKMTVFAYDTNGTYDICATLYRVNPYTHSQDEMGKICTTGSPGYQDRSTTSFNPTTIYGGHGGYIRLWLPTSTGLRAYAVQIEYH